MLGTHCFSQGIKLNDAVAPWTGLCAAGVVWDCFELVAV